MKKILVIVAIFALSISGNVFAHEGHEHSETAEKNVAHSIYQCPMHSQIKSDKPGRCSICGMKLKKQTLAEEADAQHEAATEHASHLDN